MRQLAMLCAVTFVLFFAVSCGSGPGKNTTVQREPPGTPGPAASIDFGPIPDSVWQEGAKMELNLSFANKSSGTMIMSPFPPDIKVVHANEDRPGIFVRHFEAGIGERTLEAGQSVNYVFSWDQRDANGQQVSPGWYGVQVTLATKDSEMGTTASTDGWTRVLVTSPDGALEKTIMVNESRTAGGITLNLERVDLSARGMTVYVFNVPAGYSLPQGPTMPPPQFMFNAKGEYSIDGGAATYTGPAGVRFLDNGVEMVWDNLDPIPKNAKELSFRVTSIERGVPDDSRWTGLWDFTIMLQ